MRKKIVLTIFVIVMACMCGCTSENKVKVYEDTEEAVVTHEETSLTAVITDIDLESNIISLSECISGNAYDLGYHGGVSITNTYGDYISISEIPCGSVVDVAYYSDTNKLVSIAQNSSTTVLKNVNKFSVDFDKNKATYKGTSCPLSEYVTAYDNGEKIDIREVNPEDMVTLRIYAGRLVSVVIDVGHGYVRLKNHETYVGGMVEIGYDVIVPVTEDMLVAVREGDYTLRINRGSYNASKQMQVYKGRETVVDLSDIAIPTGTAVFDVTPAEAEIYVNGDKITGSTYSNVYGTYKLKVKAEGYNDLNGSFEIADSVKTFTIKLTSLKSEDGGTTENSTDTATGDDTTGNSSTTGGEGSSGTTMSATSATSSSTEEDKKSTDSSTDDKTTEQATQSGQATNNKITIKAPVGASVYVDGDYVGKAPISFTKIVGTHTVTLYKKGYLIKSYTIQAKDNGKDDEYSFAELTSLHDLME